MISNVPMLKGGPDDLKTLQKYLATLKQELEYSFMHIDSTNIITNNTLGGKDASLSTLIDSLISLLNSEISGLKAYVNGVAYDLQDYVEQIVLDLTAFVNEALANIPSLLELTDRVDLLASLVQYLQSQIEEIGQTSFKRYDAIPTQQQIINDNIQLGEIILVKVV